MWFTKKRNDVTTLPVRTGCQHVLVLHADGTNECEGHEACGGDELLHDWWAPCHELGCACVGEEHDLTVAYAQAA